MRNLPGKTGTANHLQKMISMECIRYSLIQEVNGSLGIGTKYTHKKV
jgi:hypothetical protein